jgi:hypothetical protein
MVQLDIRSPQKCWSEDSSSVLVVSKTIPESAVLDPNLDPAAHAPSCGEHQRDGSAASSVCTSTSPRRRAGEWLSSCAGRAASLRALFVGRWSNEQPIYRRLNEAGAEVKVAGGVGAEADFQAACAFACEPIEAICQ